MHMNTNDKNIWIAIEDKDIRQDERRGLDVGAEWAGAVVGAVNVEVEGIVGTKVGGDVGALISLLLWSLLLAAPIVLH